MEKATTLPAAVWRTLQDTFGIRRLREGQEEVIARALAGKDTLAIMPTGAGKSLCYQPPALHLKGATVVVSPSPPPHHPRSSTTSVASSDARGLHVVDTGMYRPNLRLQVVQCVNDEEKLDRAVETLRRAEGAGIVYTATVKACDELHAALEARGESVTRYHGRLPKAERNANQDRFMRGEARVMVATNAFGMGIDKPALRFVVHYQMTGSLEAYYQEAGRAGRDGRKADCALLFDRRDRQVQQFFLARRYPTAEDLQRVHSVLDRASEALPVAALVGQLPGIGRQRVSVVLHLLRDHRLARADRKRLWRVARRNEAAGQEAPGSADAVLFERLAAEYEERAGRDHEALERMVFYAQTGFCRWRVLLEYFDEPLPFEREHCGKCDNCLRLQAAASAPASEPTGEFRGPEGRSREAPEQIRWRPQDEVRVPRYGTGRVEQASIDEVAVRFADGSSRRFVASYVQPAAGLSMPDEVAQRVGDA